MHQGIQLIVGLGNPGAEYEDTRHNAGAWFVSALAKATQTVLRQEKKFQGLHGISRIDDHEFHLFIPSTYMNHSGQAVKALSHFYKIPPEAMLIAHDELDLPVGCVRLKSSGGAAGHNGLTDIISHLNTRHFHRLRIGIGRPLQSKQVVDYVLKSPSKADRLLIDRALEKANDVLPMLFLGHYQKAMHALHT